jgi:hypothetical protein
MDIRMDVNKDKTYGPQTFVAVEAEDYAADYYYDDDGRIAEVDVWRNYSANDETVTECRNAAEEEIEVSRKTSAAERIIESMKAETD